MIYALWYRKTSTAEIMTMTYSELEYWHFGHELLNWGAKDPEKRGLAPVKRKRKSFKTR